ncbi:hypothetical protein [Persicobacter diffluens]|uniref:Uncharacterized protein n=1 Tax=Persicobacter diffluens TaxID=981 RepID=A0AAN5AL19_9BACT|nr:hypothetical protein PEDI_09700 [Persicobacter diffluens]
MKTTLTFTLSLIICSFFAFGQSADNSKIQITFKNLRNLPYQGEIYFEDLRSHAIFAMTTDDRGVIQGALPKGGHYWISTPSTSKIEKITVPDVENQRYYTSVVLPFYLDGQLMPSPTTTVLKLTLIDPQDQKLAKREIILKEQKSGKSRKMVTDSNGKLNTLIPKGKVFDVYSANEKKLGIVDARKLEIIQISITHQN